MVIFIKTALNFHLRSFHVPLSDVISKNTDRISVNRYRTCDTNLLKITFASFSNVVLLVSKRTAI